MIFDYDSVNNTINGLPKFTIEKVYEQKYSENDIANNEELSY